MTTIQQVYGATAATNIGDIPIDVLSATVTLDESWSPYARATLVCVLPDAATANAIDPRVPFGLRVWFNLTRTDSISLTAAYLTATYTGATAATLTTQFAGRTAAYLTALWGSPLNGAFDPAVPQFRPFTLLCRTRTLDYLAGTMTLELVSDEVKLQDFGLWQDPTLSPEIVPPQTNSLRNLVTWALYLIAAELEPGSSEAIIASNAVQWRPGESLWSFLDPFIRANGLRLACDERHRWTLLPTLTGASGSIVVDTLTRFSDTLSINDPAYGNAAVMIYDTTDAAGLTVQSYRGDGAPGAVIYKTVSQEFNSRDPVPTSAQAVALRTRAQTRGRTVDIAALSDYSTTPGMAASISTTATTVTGAMVSAVSWQLSAEPPEAEMTLTTRDAI